MKWVLRIIGFAAGASAVILVEALIVMAFSDHGYRLIPRGLGWIVVPVMVGIAGAQIASERGGAIFESKLRPAVSPQRGKLFGAGVASWTLCVLAYVFVAEPFGSYVSDEDWLFVLKVVAVPPVVAAVCLGLFALAGGDRPKSS